MMTQVKKSLMSSAETVFLASAVTRIQRDLPKVMIHQGSLKSESALDNGQERMRIPINENMVADVNEFYQMLMPGLYRQYSRQFSTLLSAMIDVIPFGNFKMKIICQTVKGLNSDARNIVVLPAG